MQKRYLSESEIQTEFKKYINNNQAGEKSYKISEIVIDLKDKNKISEIQNYINKQGFKELHQHLVLQIVRLRGFTWLVVNK